MKFKKILKPDYLFANIIALLSLIAFGYIAIMSIFQTSIFDPENYSAEHILFQKDEWLFQLVLLFFFYVFIYQINKARSFFAKIDMTIMYTVMFSFVILFGLYWVLHVQQIPGADSANIFETATEVIAGDFSSFYNGTGSYNHSFYQDISYYNFYPYQLGFVFLSEIVYRLFGTDSALPIEMLNVLYLALTYCGIARISRLVFKRKSIEFFTILLLIGCLQPILFCTFPYGNITGLFYSVWACYCLIRFLQTERYRYLIPCILFLLISILAKYNNLICMVAFVLILLVHALQKKRYENLILIFSVILLSFSVTNIVQSVYELRAGVKLEKGQPQITYFAMGLNESPRAPGWYTTKYMVTYRDSFCDAEATSAFCKEEISSNLARFAEDKKYAYDFFSKKVLSQWNEPTFQSIWVSKTKGHNIELNDFVTEMYDGEKGELYEFYVSQYTQLLYLLFSAGLLMLMLRKKANLETILLPLILLGGFGYHLLFEAKSQYAVTYIVLMIPTAAFTVQTLLCDTTGKVKAFFDENDKKQKK